MCVCAYVHAWMRACCVAAHICMCTVTPCTTIYIQRNAYLTCSMGDCKPSCAWTQTQLQCVCGAVPSVFIVDFDAFAAEKMWPGCSLGSCKPLLSMVLCSR